jgi:3-oxoacyl-[acyl-carrier protein] reductase
MENSSMADPQIPTLAGKVAIVTGGSSGIGAATCRLFAAQGARVVVGYNTGRERADAVVADLGGTGHRALPMRLEDSASLAQLAETVRRDYGRADVLVNSAGFTKAVPHARLDELTDDMFEAILRANVVGVFATIRALAPLMRETGDAVIVNLSSIASFAGSGSSIAYAASKAALDTMTLSLARVLGPEIRVVSLQPAAVATDFVPGRGRAAVEKQAAGSPLKRVVEPDDVALAILGCITHLRTATGSHITIDGGRFLV